MQLLAAAEVDALATTCAADLDAGNALSFPLTAKLVENAVDGARKSSGELACHTLDTLMRPSEHRQS
jgi:hypothetical protein